MPVTRATTADGVEYGFCGGSGATLAPTLIVAAGTITETFQTWALQAGVVLSRAGYLCVAIDLPSHGAQRRPGEPSGLHGWARQVASGQDPAHEFMSRASSVLDELIRTGRTDPDRVAASGVSRGGYLALRLAATDRRVRCAAAYAPVTDLRALCEFDAEPARTRAAALALHRMADRLVGTPLYVVIGDRDRRVNTDSAVAFARAVSRAAAEGGAEPAVSLHVLPEPRGHVTPATAAVTSAVWLDELLHVGRPRPAERTLELLRLAGVS